MTYTEKIVNKMIGKTIKNVDLDGFGMTIDFTDGTQFNFDASDGGYSEYEILEKEGE